MKKMKKVLIVLIIVCGIVIVTFGKDHFKITGRAEFDTFIGEIVIEGDNDN